MIGLVFNRLSVFAAVICIICAGPAAAQSDLLDQGQSLIEGLSGGVTAGGLGEEEIAAGLREALRVGSERVVTQVGAPDGFNLDPDIHIPLPGALEDVQGALAAVGMADLADDLELKLNRGAEAAAPEAQRLFVKAIEKMTLADVQEIYDGPDDAATQYFRKKMSPRLSKRMRPIVEDSLAEVGAVQSYDAMMSQYDSLPLMPDVKADLTDYVVEQGMDGIFYYIAKEEAAIRNDPAARTTEILKKVFGGS